MSEAKHGAIHMTMLTSLSNMCSDLPLLYTYWVVDAYGFFMPNIIGLIIAFTVLLCTIPYKKELENMCKIKVD